MGDQIGVGTSGTLHYVPITEFQRILAFPIDSLEKTALFAALCRINTLYMIARAGSGHIGSSFSSMDIMAWIQLNELCSNSDGLSATSQDVFFSSKGHDSPALYSALIGLGKLDFELIHQLRRLGGLPGHPDISTPHVITNTGSLGMGISKAKGMVMANRLRKHSGNVFVLTGDGELQEGQFWESLISASNKKLHEITVIIDHNKLQSDTLVKNVSDLGDLESKLDAFGWHVSRCDGNNFSAFSSTLAATKIIKDKPKIIIADTIKGKGVSFMEHNSIDSDVELYKFHSGAPSKSAYFNAITELMDSANALLDAGGWEYLKLQTVVTEHTVEKYDNLDRLIPAYSKALVEQAVKNPLIVALDADLILDTGLIPFKEKFPDRFFECGIAEQDMVSIAGGMALKGLIPVIHSFACFLSSRPNEQIYNNATELKKIIYVGSLAGVTPGGPGHSHQAVRDISAFSNIPKLTIIEPSCASEVSMMLDWAINTNTYSTYLRMVSVPCDVPYQLPIGYKPQLGKGLVLIEGGDIAIVAYGPTMLCEAVMASQVLKEQHNVQAMLINLPWLNVIDNEWLLEKVSDCKILYSIDNHFIVGGQGDSIANVIASSVTSKLTLVRVGLDEIPVSGTNKEVLNKHKLDAEGIVKRVLATFY